MGSILNPYLSFRDTTREVMGFYQSVFGGELTFTTFGDYQASEDPSESDKIMHAQLETPSGFTLMASDTPNSMQISAGTNFSISLSGPAEDSDTLRGYWAKLIEGGTVTMPLDTAPWGGAFGMVVDRFGVSWMLNVAS